MGSLTSRFQHMLGKGDGDDESGEIDDLDESTAALLSMLPTAPIIVDGSNEVVRSNPEAYRLGVVRNDTVIEPEVLAAIEKVRASGGKCHVDVTTDTPQEFLAKSGKNGQSKGKGPHIEGDEALHSEVSRPNWLHVTVGRINDSFVVVLVDDVSENIRFAQTRDAFITNVSEQLTKPIQALQQLASRLEHGEEPQEAIAADARSLRQYCLHLEHTVADLMLLIKAQEKVVPNDTNRIAPLELAKKVARSLEPMAQEADVTIQVGGDGDVLVNADTEQITAALRKLVENAIGYSSKGGHVNVAVGKTSEGSHAVIRVVDQGTGIAKAQREHIFERFYRGDNQNERTAGGVGLGLAIVKHVALTHNGSVTLWSAPRQGSTFSLLLPLAR